MRKRYQVRWLDHGDLCVEYYTRYEQAVAWFKVLNTRIMCGDKIEIIEAPRR